jgi:predicted aspartyl protease
MGLTYIEGVVTGPKGKPATVSFLVDSAATYMLLAEKDWRALGLAAKRSVTFTLADGTQIERAISECHLALPQGEGHTPVILRQDDDQPLLGVVTLEILGFVLNPFNRTLQPMRNVAGVRTRPPWRLLPEQGVVRPFWLGRLSPLPFRPRRYNLARLPNALK